MPEISTACSRLSCALRLDLKSTHCYGGCKCLKLMCKQHLQWPSRCSGTRHATHMSAVCSLYLSASCCYNRDTFHHSMKQQGALGGCSEMNLVFNRSLGSPCCSRRLDNMLTHCEPRCKGMISGSSHGALAACVYNAYKAATIRLLLLSC